MLHGASIQEDARGHGDALTGADMDRIVARLRGIHANATRAQHPLSPELLSRLDAAGILVWQGVGPVDSPGNWTARTPAMRAVARARVRTSVAQLQTHPSILAWNLANEVGGQGHSGGQAAFIDAMARELRRTDPGRLVALDIWGKHPRNGANPTWRPGGFAFQSRLLATHIRTYAQIPSLSGMLVWALSDFAVSPQFLGGSINRLVPGIRLVRGLNQKGLFTYGGRAKPAAGVVARAFARLPQ